MDDAILNLAKKAELYQTPIAFFSTSDSKLEQTISNFEMVQVLIDLTALSTVTSIPVLTTIDAIALLPKNTIIAIIYASSYTEYEILKLHAIINSQQLTCYFFDRLIYRKKTKLSGISWGVSDSLFELRGDIAYYANLDTNTITERIFDL